MYRIADLMKDTGAAAISIREVGAVGDEERAALVRLALLHRLHGESVENRFHLPFASHHCFSLTIESSSLFLSLSRSLVH